MGPLLSQALMLTLIGMGMTFAAIAVLVLGMYVMPMLIKEKRSNEDEYPDEVADVRSLSAFDDDPGPAGMLQDQAAATAAAAAAVAVALAEEAAEARCAGAAQYAAAAAAVAVAVATSAPSMARPEAAFAPAGAWNAYVRGQRLARRNLYNVRRSHHANLPRDYRR